MEIDELWDFEDPAGSESRFRSAAEATEASGDERAVLLTQAARALGLQQRYDEGHALLDELLAADSATSLGPEVVVRLALERGRLHRSAGQVEAAGPAFAEATELARAAGLAGLHVDALHMRALLADGPDAQIAAHRAALEVALASTDPAARKWEASLLNNVGCAQVDAGDLDGALGTFEAALAVRRARGQVREEQIARWMVAWTLRLLGRTDEALALQTALKAELAAAGTDDPYVDEELGLLTG